MNISRINLNLLVTLDALLTERHVTRAGERIGITQSAMSSALNQLRGLFADELLVRSPKGMILTTRATELVPQVKKIVDQLQGLLTNQQIFDPLTAERVFTVGMSDYMETILLPKLCQKLRKTAPHVKLKVKHINYFSVSEPIDNYEVELGIVFKVEKLEEAPKLHIENLFSVNAVCTARADHPLMNKKITLDDYTTASHIKVEYEKIPQQNRIDVALKKLGKSRKLPIIVPHYLPVLFALSNTQLLATIPDIFPEKILNSLNLKAQQLPFLIPPIEVVQVWNEQYDNDPGHYWLRGVIKEVSSLIANEKIQ
jgi:DNA-binding transcriptional LysR family regulator